MLSCEAALDLLRWPTGSDVPCPSVYDHAFDCLHPKSLVDQMPEDSVPVMLELYYDEFETANPLGPHKGIYHMGVFYYTIKNLPNYFNSNSSNIHLLAIGHAKEFKVTI